MKQLDPKAVWLFFISQFISVVPVAILGVFCGIFSELSAITNWGIGSFVLWITIGVVIILIIAFVIAKLSYHFYRYELTDIGFKKESGIIWKRYVTIPYDRIQNVDIYRGVIARILGLSDLQIHTAGVGGVAMGEGRLPGLSFSDADIIRDELINRSRQSRNGQGF
ncbi:MAG: PH domain-containing protein [Patescibacteria group bacterium]